MDRSVVAAGEVIVGEDHLAQRARALLADPAFPAAAVAFTAAMNRFRREGRGPLNKLLGRDIRFRVVNLCFCLHVRGVLVGPERGASFGEMVEATRRTLGGSPRVVRTTLDMMRKLGLVDVEVGSTDRRVSIFVPTPALLATVRVWLAGVMAHLDLLEPAGRRAERFAAEPGFVEHVAVAMGDAFLAGEPLTGRVPELSCFFLHECGWPVLNTVVAHARDGLPLPTLGVLADTYGLTKSQVANVVTLAVESGFLVRDAGGRATVTPALVAAYDRWAATFFAFMLSVSDTTRPPADPRLAAALAAVQLNTANMADDIKQGRHK